MAEAGTSLSVFHYCFDSKQELLDAVIKSLVGTNIDLAEASFDTGRHASADDPGRARRPTGRTSSPTPTSTC